MPLARARRGRWAGRADSLISRLITATTASEAGNSISSAASSVQPQGGASAIGPWSGGHQQPGNQAQRAQRHRGEVDRSGRPPRAPQPRGRERFTLTERVQQRRPTRADQPVARDLAAGRLGLGRVVVVVVVGGGSSVDPGTS